MYWYDNVCQQRLSHLISQILDFCILLSFDSFLCVYRSLFMWVLIIGLFSCTGTTCMSSETLPPEFPNPSFLHPAIIKIFSCISTRLISCRSFSSVVSIRVGLSFCVTVGLFSCRSS